jgi:hypothetical protein
MRLINMPNEPKAVLDIRAIFKLDNIINEEAS